MALGSAVRRAVHAKRRCALETGLADRLCNRRDYARTKWACWFSQAGQLQAASSLQQASAAYVQNARSQGPLISFLSHLVVFGKLGDVVAPVSHRSTEAMHQDDRLPAPSDLQCRSILV